MPRSTVSKAQLRHNPLYVDIKDEPLIKEKRPKSRKSTKSNDFAEENLDPKSTAKVLELAQLQQIEIMGDEDTTDEWHGSLSTEEPYEQPHGPSSFHSIRDVRKADSDDENEIGDENFMQKTDSDAIDPHTLDVSDLAALDNLYPANAVERKTLADVIFAKMADSSNVAAKGDKTLASDDSDPASGLNPKVVEAFMKVGQAMRGSGPLPKIVKVIPSFPAWRRYLALTSPENWHPLACRKVTHIYISSMKSNQAEFYFRHVLLPAFRDNITTNGSLNVHYHEALLRCLFKPAAFFKGFLFPLLEESCSLKEAIIVASILSKKSIPSAHLGAAIIHIASADYSGPRALILRVLLDKKKDLPYRVLDELIYHFIRISNWSKSKNLSLPVLWHQSLLVFSQRYSANITQDQKDALLDVVRTNFHHQIGPEIRRELTSTSSRSTIDVIMS